MRVAIYTAFIALAASLTSATAVSTGAIELTADQIIEITGTSQKPPFKNPDPSNPNNNGWKFPSTSKLQLAKNVGGNCNFTVIMDVSRCSGLESGQEAVAFPYNEDSMKMLHGNMHFESGASNGKLYAQKRIELKQCGFNGRFFLMNQQDDNVFATSQMSVRLVLDQDKAYTWVTADPDVDETGLPQSRSAPLIRRFFGSDSKEIQAKRVEGDEKPGHRGKRNSLQTTTVTKDNYMFLQWC